MHAPSLPHPAGLDKRGADARDVRAFAVKGTQTPLAQPDFDPKGRADGPRVRGAAPFRRLPTPHDLAQGGRVRGGPAEPRPSAVRKGSHAQPPEPKADMSPMKRSVAGLCVPDRTYEFAPGRIGWSGEVHGHRSHGSSARSRGAARSPARSPPTCSGTSTRTRPSASSGPSCARTAPTASRPGRAAREHWRWSGTARPGSSGEGSPRPRARAARRRGAPPRRRPNGSRSAPTSIGARAARSAAARPRGSAPHRGGARPHRPRPRRARGATQAPPPGPDAAQVRHRRDGQHLRRRRAGQGRRARRGGHRGGDPCDGAVAPRLRPARRDDRGLWRDLRDAGELQHHPPGARRGDASTAATSSRRTTRRASAWPRSRGWRRSSGSTCSSTTRCTASSSATSTCAAPSSTSTSRGGSSRARGIVINTGEDNYLTTADAVEKAHTVLASQFINEAFAMRAGLARSR